MSKYDVIVIGAGPGGYVAAIKCAQLGLKTAIVERENLGGVCLNWGCIPSKSLLHSAYSYAKMKQQAAFFELAIAEEAEMAKLQQNWQKMVGKSREVAANLRHGVEHLLRKNNVSVYFGAAKLQSRNHVVIEASQHFTGEADLANKVKNSANTCYIKDQPITLEAAHIILASGSRPRNLPQISIDGECIWGYREAMTSAKVPSELLVIGSGAIGIEFASIYANLGSKVTIIEIASRILAQEDAEISKIMHDELLKRGINIHLGAQLESQEVILQQNGENSEKAVKVRIKLANGEIFTHIFNNILLAVGVVPNSEDLDLDKVGVALKPSGHVVINEFSQSSLPNIFAIGDIGEPPFLAHKASHEAIMVAQKIAGLPGVHPLNKRRIPGCIYATPEIASVGYTEEQAIAEGLAFRKSIFPFQANGKALAVEAKQGMVKLLCSTAADSEGEIIGVHMIGQGVTEMLFAMTIAMTAEATEREIIDSIAPHPTMSEALHEAALGLMGKAIHI